MKLIAATLSRHVASPWIYNNDSSRPGRYIMPRKRQGTIIPVMNTNRYYPYPSLKLPHFERKRITPFDVNHKNREHHHIATLGSAPFSCAKLRIILQISKLSIWKVVIMEDKPPHNQYSSLGFLCTRSVGERPVGIFSPHNVNLLGQWSPVG